MDEIVVVVVRAGGALIPSFKFFTAVSIVAFSFGEDMSIEFKSDSSIFEQKSMSSNPLSIKVGAK